MDNSYRFAVDASELERLAAEEWQCGTPDGCRLIKLATTGHARGNNYSLALQGSYMYMFGPNPVANSGQSMYYPGQQYSGAYLRTDVDFINTDKDGKALETDYAGFGIVGRALGMRMAQHIKGKTG